MLCGLGVFLLSEGLLRIASMEKDRLSFSRASLYPELSFSMSPWIVGPALACPESSWEEHSVCAQDDASRGWCTFILELLGTQRAHRGGVQGS